MTFLSPVARSFALTARAAESDARGEASPTPFGLAAYFERWAAQALTDATSTAVDGDTRELLETVGAALYMSTLIRRAIGNTDAGASVRVLAALRGATADCHTADEPLVHRFGWSCLGGMLEKAGDLASWWPDYAEADARVDALEEAAALLNSPAVVAARALVASQFGS